MQPLPDIIIIRGAPGSGKSQTAKSLAAFFPGGVRLEVDTVRHMIISVNWTDQEEHISMLQVSARLVREFIVAGYSPVIVVDTFSGNKLQGFLDQLQKHSNCRSVKIIGLYTNEAELKKRLELRPEDEFRDFSISSRINKRLLLKKYETEVQIDTTGLKPEEAAEKIFSFCKGQEG